MRRSATDAVAWAVAGLAVFGATGCGAAAPVVRPAESTAEQTVGEAWLLGPLPRSGCFHVRLVSPDRYRFEIDDVDYRRALGAGHVEITIHATDMADLEPRPVALPRTPRLTFEAHGIASGAFELTLLLVDGQGRQSDPAKLTQICDTPAR